MPMLRNLGFRHFQYKCALVLAQQRNETSVTQDGKLDVIKCLMFLRKIEIECIQAELGPLDPA
jgi:hypothetical protein